MLMEDGSIQRRDGTWAASADIATAMPDTIQAAIAARIDRLETSEKRVIQMASVVGRNFWVGGPDELSDADVETAIDTLMARGLIRLRPTSSIAGTSEYAFEHALIRESHTEASPAPAEPRRIARCSTGWSEGPAGAMRSSLS